MFGEHPIPTKCGTEQTLAELEELLGLETDSDDEDSNEDSNSEEDIIDDEAEKEEEDTAPSQLTLAEVPPGTNLRDLPEGTRLEDLPAGACITINESDIEFSDTPLDDDDSE